MSQSSVPNTPKTTPEALRATEAELHTESAAIEKLRKQLSEAGAGASKESVAAYAKRQKAFLDRKIDFEKQKRALIEAPAPANKTVPKPPAAPEKKETPKPAAPPRPSEAAKQKAAPAKASAAKKPAESKPAAPEPPKKRVESAKPKAAAPRKRETPLLDDEEDEHPDAPQHGGISPLVWLLLATAICVVIWYFATR